MSRHLTPGHAFQSTIPPAAGDPLSRDHRPAGSHATFLARCPASCAALRLGPVRHRRADAPRAARPRRCAGTGNQLADRPRAVGHRHARQPPRGGPGQHRGVGRARGHPVAPARPGPRRAPGHRHRRGRTADRQRPPGTHHARVGRALVRAQSRGPGRYYVYYLPFTMAGPQQLPDGRLPAAEQTPDPAWLRRLRAVLHAPRRAWRPSRPSTTSTASTRWRSSRRARKYGALLAPRPGRAVSRLPGGPAPPHSHAHAICRRRWVTWPGDRSLLRARPRGASTSRFSSASTRVEALADVQVQFSRSAASSDAADSRRGPHVPQHARHRLATARPSRRRWTWRSEHRPGALVRAGRARATRRPGPTPARRRSRPARRGHDDRRTSRSRCSTRAWPRTAAPASRGSRRGLKWLDSTLAQANDVIAPYTPLTVDGSTIDAARPARDARPALACPTRIQTFFTQEMTSISSARRTTSSTAPMELVAETSDGSPLPWTSARAGVHRDHARHGAVGGRRHRRPQLDVEGDGRARVRRVPRPTRSR